MVTASSLFFLAPRCSSIVVLILEEKAKGEILELNQYDKLTVNLMQCNSLHPPHLKLKSSW